VIGVYSGDTLTILAEIAGATVRLKVRAAGIDAPELRGETFKEREAAAAVRDFVRSRCMGLVVLVSPRGVDEYGRLLAEVTSEDGSWSWCQSLRDLGLCRDNCEKIPFAESELTGVLARAIEALGPSPRFVTMSRGRPVKLNVPE